MEGYSDLLSLHSFFTNWIHGKKKGGQEDQRDYIYIQFLQFTKGTLSLKVSFPYCGTAYFLKMNPILHGLRTPNEGINQRYLKNWADVADKICCRHT